MKKYIFYFALILLPLAMKAMYSGKGLSPLQERYVKWNGWLVGDDSEPRSRIINKEIKKIIETNQETEELFSLFAEACTYDECSDLIESLLAMGFDHNKTSEYFPLHNACKNGSLKNATLLLKYKANPNIANEAGETPLILAAKRGYLEIVNLLLKHKDILVNAEDKQGNAALISAVKAISAHSIDPTFRMGNIIINLLDAGANPYATNQDMENLQENKSDKTDGLIGNTPADQPRLYYPYWEATNGQFRNVYTEIYRAIDIRSSKKSKQLGIEKIRHKINTHIKNEIDPSDKRWISLLLKAAFHKKCYDLIELMLKNGVNPNVTNGFLDVTPLCNACWSGALTNVALLLKFNADPNLGHPLITAVQKGHLEVVTLLVRTEGINVDIQDEFGNTALMKVFPDRFFENDEKPYGDLILLLLNASANPSITNKKGKTAINIAREKGFDGLAELMENYESMSKLNTISKEMEQVQF